VEFRILGPVGLWSHDQEIVLNGTKQRTVLAALLLARERVLFDRQIGEMLWGKNPPATYQAQIYTYVSRLRQCLRDYSDIARKGSGYVMRLTAARFDYTYFEELSMLGRTALRERRYGEAAETLRAALDLWRGPTLTDVTEYLAEAESPAIEEARIAATECRIAADLALGRYDQVIAELIGLVGTHPLRERLRAQLMMALYQSGRQADAFAVFHEGRQQLEEELGVFPGAALRKTYQAILAGDLWFRQPARLSVPARTAPGDA
jgi:DNA-binding SARP family transcriptional activator